MFFLHLYLSKSPWRSRCGQMPCSSLLPLNIPPTAVWESPFLWLLHIHTVISLLRDWSLCFCLSFALHSRRFPWLGLQVAYLFITSETFNQSAILLRFYLVMHAFSSKNVFFFTIYFFFIAACSYFMDMIAYHILERGDINMYFILF